MGNICSSLNECRKKSLSRDILTTTTLYDINSNNNNKFTPLISHTNSNKINEPNKFIFINPLKSFNLKEGFSRQDWSQIFNASDLPEMVRTELTRNIPTLLNSYEREYFQSFDKVFRFTVDYNLKFFNVKSMISSFREKSLPEKTIILELKYDLKNDKEVKKITNALPIRLGKFSKYIRGVEIFNPHLAV